ncbi:putative oxalate decarboxylase/oxidase [Phlebopus sp. FC_14]|nr:putative oxalate decarboxylase/oxidase [Phlebopus sp. FC_14]
MASRFSAVLIPFIVAAAVVALPASDPEDPIHASPRAVSSAPFPSPTVPYASDDPNNVLWLPTGDTTPKPQRGSLGATVLGPQNVELDLMNADFLAPPTTDNGDVANIKWPMGLSHNRLQTGGWARQQNNEVLPIATAMAGVNMRLVPGAIRELHWHKTAEWAYVIKGGVQVTAVNPDGQNYISTIGTGDLWYFPAGIPHSLQATADDPDGAEFLLVFDEGDFSEDATFLVSHHYINPDDWLAHIPKEVIAKNFQTDISAFNTIPSKELYIFPAIPPPDDEQVPQSPQGTVPNPFTYSLSKVPVTSLSGGAIKIVDSTVFTVSKTIAAAEVTIEPGAMRELHWHPTQDEWDFFLEGTARITLFASSSKARTFDFQAGDVAYIPASFGHYAENIGNTTLKLLEITKTDKYQDISLAQWLALTPPELVKAHLGLSDETIAAMNKTKQIVVGPA